MNQLVFSSGADSPVLQHAAAYLRSQGCCFSSTADESVTHLLLPIPSFDAQGKPKADFPLSLLPPDAVLIGGNFPADYTISHPVMDLLKDETYLYQNASITAHCAIKTALRHMDQTFRYCPVLVIGWGRIGKCLARLLRGLDAKVAVAARKRSDRAMAEALGYATIPTEQLAQYASRYQIVFNTVPHAVLCAEHCSKEALLLELASVPGITGGSVIDARGLPGKEAPRASGILIGQTILRLVQEKGLVT